MAEKKVYEFSVESNKDTLSYALGFVWANNLSAAGISNLNYCFYKGAQDYLKGDTSILGIFEANKFLNNHRDTMQHYIWPTRDTTVLLSQVDILTMADTFCYAVGLVWSKGTSKFGLKHLEPAVINGFYDGLRNDSSLFTIALANEYLSSFLSNLRIGEFEDIKNMNELWLEENKVKEGIITTESGLQYRIISSGKGKKSSDSNIFECHYIGKLIDGTVFENTYSTGKPDRFFLSAIKPGMIEALLMMHEGDKWEIFIPSELAFGPGGISKRVPPFSTVIYELELVRLSTVQ